MNIFRFLFYCFKMFYLRQPHNEEDDPVIFLFRRVSLRLLEERKSRGVPTDSLFCSTFRLFSLYRQINFSAFLFFPVLSCIYLLLSFIVTVVWILGAYTTSLKEKEITIFSFRYTQKGGENNNFGRQCGWTIDSEGEARENLFVNLLFRFDKSRKTITMRYFGCLSVSWRLVICCVKNKSTDKTTCSTFRAETSSAKVTMLYL